MLSTRYNPAEIENKWYEHWEKMGYFHSEPDEREPYCVLIPPPNVTGILHMGHMLNNTIQDILIRKARLDGKNACWVPGTDHASIATEAKVVRQLREKGIKKSDISREEFIKHAWDWTDKYGGIILKQLRKLGASCDWDRTVFTMDEERSEQVIKVFVDLYKKGKLYRGLRMINWDPKAKTVLSNEEVLYKEENSNLYYVRYEIVGAPADDPGVTIATTRPETILGDTAIAVHPKDERFQHLKGKKVKVPLLNREIPVVFDDYVDREFGTGALKITPAHDPNDYEIGKKHNLETIDIFNEDATLSDAAELFIGMGRFDARKAMVKQLEEEGYLLKVEPYQNKVGRSERTNSVVEPRLSKQWYVNMKELSDPALKAVMDGDISFYPSNMVNIYRHWLENVRDWCISRQLWWGHRIPAYYLGEELFVAETAVEALEQAREKTGNASLQLEDMKQEEDVLDTWFSSWLWPFSVFNGLDNDNKDVAYYYPTAVLVTGWDIIFLWVARMIMAGYEWKGQLPFKHVYFTGMVRDPQGRRMSKSLGNSPDPLELIAEYGADGVRFGMLSCSPAGNDLLFDVSLCDQGKKFCNKMWNALRLIKSWEPEDKPQSKVNKMAVTWFGDLLNKRIAEQEVSFSKNKLSEGLISLYSLIWTDFCSWYLELIKPTGESNIDQQTYEQTIELFSDLMIMLHPYMPFVSEELWHELAEREENNDCMVSSYPKSEDFEASTISAFEEMKTLVSKVREVRNSKGIKRNEELELHILKGTKPEWFESDIKHCVMKAAFTGQITEIDDVPDGATGFTTGRSKWYLILNQEIDVEKELERLNAELDHNRKFVAGISKKLDNPGFVNNAPEAVVAMERKKLADGQARIENLEKSIAALQ